MFALWKGLKTTLHFEDYVEEHSIADTLAPLANFASGSGPVDPACNVSITLSCIQQLYNVGGYVPKATKENKIGITGYLEKYANIEDLQSFYADQRPDALNSTFKFVSVKGKQAHPISSFRLALISPVSSLGGLNSQNLSEAGLEANLDVQFAFGLSYPTPGTFWSTAGRPPFKPDLGTPTNTNGLFYPFLRGRPI